jgi:hypothetical protein
VNRKDYDMNEGTGSSRGLPRWTSALAAGAGTALLVAACAGSGSSSASPSTAVQQAVAFAQCMRIHGAPSWPDPNSQGVFISDKATRADFRAPASANRACQHLLPSVGHLTPAQQRQDTTQALKFVACMRSHGIPDWPDPVVDAGGVVFNGTGGVAPGSPLMRSAQQACRMRLPAPGAGS